MGDVVDRSDAFVWSISKMAEFFEMDRKTVAKRIKDAGLKPAGERRGNAVYKALDVAKCILSPGGQPGTTLDLDQFPEARKAWYQSELYRVQLEEKLGQLIPDTEYVRCMAAFTKSVSASLDSIPDVLERDAGLDPDSLMVVIEVIDAARAVMAESARKALSDDS